MFNTGLPPLDRQGLFPSHGSILDPLQTSSFSPFTKKVEKPSVVTVNLASESDEEVLVDDFDGQCCRTYPDNHSRIIKWRAQRAEKAKQQKSAAVQVAAPTNTTIKPSTSLVTRKPPEKSKENPSGIPVGIAIGRQRQPGTSVPPSNWPLASPTGCGPGPGQSSSGQPMLGSHWVPPPHHLTPSPAGPIPMGYQLAKDPLTGQILLIPTDPSQPQPASSSWPHLPNRYPDYGLEHQRIPPGVLQSHYHQLYLQQQQHLRYYQQQHGLRSPMHHLPPAAAAASHSFPTAPKRIEARKEPETITVSSDEEEVSEPKPIDLVAKPQLKETTEQKQPSDLSVKPDEVKIKQEPLDQEDSAKKLIADILLELSIAKEPKPQENEAFEDLLKGIELYENTENGLDMLCAVTDQDGRNVVKYTSSQMILASRLDVLCCVTKGDKIDIESYVDPIAILKQSYNLHEYHSDNSAVAIQNFIQNKATYFKKLAEVPDGCFMDDKEPPSLSKILKKIKNTEFMSDLEVELRRQLMELQDDYSEKQKKLTSMKSPRKKMRRKMKRTPGKVTKRGTPKKLTPKRRNSHSPALGRSPSRVNAPPRLEPSSPPRLQTAAASAIQSWKQSSALLKPPKLTASNLGASSTSSLKKCVTNLSTINAKFMKGKPSPFANLMQKLASNPPGPSTSGTSSPVKAMPDIDEEEENHTEPTEESEESSSDEYTFDDDKDQSFAPGKRMRSSSLDDSSSSKKRKADKPKKQSGTTETIVPKKPKNLFMMNCYEFDGSYPSKDDEFDEESDKSEEDQETEVNTEVPSVLPPVRQTTESEDPLTSSTTTLQFEKRKGSPVPPHLTLRDARLTETDLSDGLRLLILQDGRFWPAWLHSTQLPDVYGIVMEKQRGNRPQILPRDDILREAVRFRKSKFYFADVRHSHKNKKRSKSRSNFISFMT